MKTPASGSEVRHGNFVKDVVAHNYPVIIVNNLELTQHVLPNSHLRIEISH